MPANVGEKASELIKSNEMTLQTVPSSFWTFLVLRMN